MRSKKLWSCRQQGSLLPLRRVAPSPMAFVLLSGVILGTGMHSPLSAQQVSEVLQESPSIERDSHLERNPVFARLLGGEPGEVFQSTIALPRPKMPDGLSATEQRAIIEQVCAPKYSLERFLEPRVEAPHVLEIEHEPMSDDDRPLQRNQIDLYFVASGQLESVSDPEFLSQIFDVDPEAEQNRQVAAEELSEAGIDPAGVNADHESYSQVDATIFDRIELAGVGHSIWSQTADSIVLAVHIDQRFADQPTLAPRWERFERQDDGSMQSAETGAYPGAGAYLKITRLEEPAGRLFIEAHGVLLEPYSWFRGRSLLVSKLPPAVRSQVKEIRRRAARASL